MRQIPSQTAEGEYVLLLVFRGKEAIAEKREATHFGTLRGSLDFWPAFLDIEWILEDVLDYPEITGEDLKSLVIQGKVPELRLAAYKKLVIGKFPNKDALQVVAAKSADSALRNHANELLRGEGQLHIYNRTKYVPEYIKPRIW